MYWCRLLRQFARTKQTFEGHQKWSKKEVVQKFDDQWEKIKGFLTEARKKRVELQRRGHLRASAQACRSLCFPLDGPEERLLTGIRTT